MFSRRATRVGYGVAVAFAALTANPSYAGDMAKAPTVTAGSCIVCHGPGGRSLGSIPSIAGQDAARIAEALRAYRDGTRTGTIMGRLAAPLPDEEIDLIAAWFAAMPEPGR